MSLNIVAPPDVRVTAMLAHPTVRAVLKAWPGTIITTPREGVAVRSNMQDPTNEELDAMEFGSLPFLGEFMDETFGPDAKVYDLATLSDDKIMEMIECIVTGYVTKLHELATKRSAEGQS